MIPFLPYLLPYIVNRWTIGGLVGLGLLAGAYVKGYMAARDQCQDNALKAQIASLKRDMLAWKLADDIEQSLQADLAAELSKLERKVQDYEAELAKRPADARCSLTPDDVRSLNRMRGGGK